MILNSEPLGRAYANGANFHLPNGDISSPTFNEILAAEPPRLIQLH
jgi:hypothetical protein